jgi:hypothetical protein
VATSALGDSLYATSALDDSLYATSALDDSLFATSVLGDSLFADCSVRIFWVDCSVYTISLSRRSISLLFVRSALLWIFLSTRSFLLDFSVRSFGALLRCSVLLLYRDPVAFLRRSGFCAACSLATKKGESGKVPRPPGGRKFRHVSYDFALVLLAPSLSVSSRCEFDFSLISLIHALHLGPDLSNRVFSNEDRRCRFIAWPVPNGFDFS